MSTDSLLVNERQFRFDLVGPEKIEVSSLEERVTLPGEEGDFMVLPGHTMLLAGLRPGVVSVAHATNNAMHYFIEGGFADVGNTHCTVLSPNITPVARIVADQVTRAIEAIDDEINDAEDSVVKARLEKDRAVLELKLEAAQRYNV